MTIDDFIAEWHNDCDYIVAHTSGSTGTPKEIHLCKRLVRDSALRTIEFFSLSESSYLHLCLSPDYIAGKMMIVRSLLSGATLTDELPSNTPLSSFKGGVIDLLAVVPSQLIDLLDNPKDYVIRNLIIGGSAIPADLRLRVANSGLNAYETYGMTETASHVALRKIRQESDLPYFALPGIKFTKDKRDCLIIHMNDYDPVVTNDVVDLIDEEHFLLRGRVDNVIISGGLKIHPLEVEDKIRHILPDATTFYITSRPHSKWGEEVIMIVEGDATKIDGTRILTQLRDLMPPYQTPKDILFESQILRTDSGKIVRKKF